MSKTAPTGPKKAEITAKDVAKLSEYDSAFLEHMAEVCKKRCILMHQKAELSVVEENCLDRCANKYMQTADIIHKSLSGHALL